MTMTIIFNKLKSQLSLFTTPVRYTLCLFFLSLLAASCRQKDKSVAPAKCEGYFVSIFNTGSTEVRNILCLSNAENNGFDNHVEVSASWGELNWRNGRYYHITSYSKGTTFKYVNLDAFMKHEMGTYILHDTSNLAPAYHKIICNTLSDILYCFSTQSDACKLYEVSRNGIFNVRLIGVYDSCYDTWSADVDENSGNIYAMCGNTLKKIDPNTGNSFDVATYTNALPEKLFYNDNDKFFYALEGREQFRNSGHYRLLRINPADGILNVQGIIDGMDTFNYYQIVFDHCNNQLIHLRYQNPPSTFYRDAYWVNLNDASIASSLSNIWSVSLIGYINGKFPKRN